jgi:SpoVK/Ycf46/Vps4 family AAA+-type ATPase
VKKVIEEEFFNQLKSVSPNDIRCTVPNRKSVLLFGPPGTAKTTVVRRLAKAVGWPCVEIRPSNFLQRGLDNIYVIADEIFEDLLDLSRTIIFFDEMDALVQSRTMPLDATRQFLTTSMLPKLAELHDEGRSAFFVATNYRATFDEAITRPGRFDLLLFVGPPSWTEKLTKIESMVTSSPAGKDIVGKDETRAKLLASELKNALEQWAKDAVLTDDLVRFTYDETKTLLEELLRSSSLTSASQDIVKAVQAINKTTFVSLVQNWSENYIILREGSPSGDRPNDSYSNYIDDRSKSRRQ